MAEDLPEGPTTDSSEATTVHDIAASYKEEQAEVRNLMHTCDASAPEGPGYSDAYQACRKEDAEPVRAGAERTALDAFADLQRDVGPECRRALRRAGLTIQSKSLPALARGSTAT